MIYYAAYIYWPEVYLLCDFSSSSFCKSLQDVILKLTAIETVITQVRSLKAKFAICEKGEKDTEELDK